MKTFAFLILFALLAGGAWWFVSDRLNGEEADTGPAQTAKVEHGSIEEIVEASGFVQPLVSTEVRSEISGRIESIFIEDGQPVKKDDKLIELEKTSLLSDLDEAQRNTQAAELRLEKAQRDYDRERGLREEGFTNERSYLDAKTELELQKLNVAVRQAQLDKAEENLSKTIITAPHDGIVTQMDLNEGQVITGATSVNEGTSLLAVNDLERLYVQIDINELDIGKLTEGMPARVSFDALPDQEFTGEIAQIYPYARNENNQRVFRVRVTFNAEGARVLPGISANVAIAVASVSDVPTVPISAVFTEDGSRFVYVQQGESSWHRQAVEIGLRNTQRIEIKQGLEIGQTVSLVRPAQWSDSTAPAEPAGA
ncbi:MAG: efflux RND transporter periplasmic adaptor subunit [Opitutales bacterium]